MDEQQDMACCKRDMVTYQIHLESNDPLSGYRVRLRGGPAGQLPGAPTYKED